MLTCALLGLAGCLADSVGVDDLTVVVEGATAEGVWVSRPGEDTLVRVRLYNLEGEPVAGARVSWIPTGTGSNVSTLSAVSDARGYAVARWRIGTDASERQQLRFTARSAHASRELLFNGQVVPSVVAALRTSHELPLVARLGDTLHVAVVAVDPYGNEFAAPDLNWSVADATVGAVVDSAVIAGPRRGASVLRVVSGSVAAEFALQVVQRVAAIEVVDTLRFTSLRAEQTLSYVVRDDRGQVVVDTAPTFTVADTAVAQLVGGVVRAVAPGVTALRVSLGMATTDVAIDVRQRIASLRLIRDTVHFNALRDTTTLRVVAYDSLGSYIGQPALVYEVSGDSVARIAGTRTIEALGPGTAVVTARDPITGLAASLEVLVQQRVATIDMSAAPIEFDALGDSVVVIATAHDRLGSLISGVSLEYVVADTTVAAFEAGGNRLLAVGQGQTMLTVRDPESGLEATKVVRVDQVATTLSVTVTFGGPVVTLPSGAALPLECTAADRNGFAVAKVPTLVRSVRGTVTGAGCADARVQHSGYDTLFFALGVAQVQVPVLVSTGDTVVIISAAQPLTADLRYRFEGEDFNNPLILALRPLVAEIMEAYGNPTSSLDRVRALRDWVARTAIHPDPELHPNGSTANRSVLPPGKTWGDVNGMTWKEAADNSYWDGAFYDGYAMLDRLLGELNPSTGTRAENGLMEHVGGARYRIRDVETYHYVLCTYQSIILNALLAADGLHSVRAAIVGHDPVAVFIPELGRWTYEDPTYNEEYLLDGAGQPLSILELLALSSAGEAGRLHAAKLAGPAFDAEPYVAGRRYLDAGHPEGMVIAGGQLYGRVAGMRASWAGRYVQIDVPALVGVPAPWSDPRVYGRVSADVAFPLLAPVVSEVRTEDSVQVIHLASTYPNHQRFERRLAGQTWEPVEDVDVLPVGACRVEYRSLDAVGSTSASAVVDVWAPRAEDFVRNAPAGTVRARAQYCVSPPVQ